MIDQKDLDLRARLSAIEEMLGQITAFIYERSGFTLSEVDKLHQMHMANLRSHSLVITDDPFLSDLGSDAICAHVERLQAGIRTLAAVVLKPGS